MQVIAVIRENVFLKVYEGNVEPRILVVQLNLLDTKDNSNQNVVLRLSSRSKHRSCCCWYLSAPFISDIYSRTLEQHFH